MLLLPLNQSKLRLPSIRQLLLLDLRETLVNVFKYWNCQLITKMKLGDFIF